MIKSVHRLYVAKNEREYNAIVAVFSALNLVEGESWKGRRSTGIKLEAVSSGVEIGFGEGFPNADLVIEVDSADDVFKTAQTRGFIIADTIVDCDWGARMFVLALPNAAGRVAIFSYNEKWRPNEIGSESPTVKQESLSGKSSADDQAASKKPRKSPRTKAAR